jgi:hypothetical protein
MTSPPAAAPNAPTPGMLAKKSFEGSAFDSFLVIDQSPNTFSRKPVKLRFG